MRASLASAEATVASATPARRAPSMAARSRAGSALEKKPGSASLSARSAALRAWVGFG